MNKTAERKRIEIKKREEKIIERWDHERMGPKKIRKQRATATRRKEDKKGKMNLHQNVRTRRKMNLVKRPLQNEERKSDLGDSKEKWGEQVKEEQNEWRRGNRNISVI